MDMLARKRIRFAVIMLILLVCIVFVQIFVAFVLRHPLKNEHVPRKFGATYMTMDNQYFELLNSLIEEIVESNGDRLITRDPANSQLKQNEQIMDMLDMGVDLIFVNPVDYESIAPALVACHERNVPFINIDTTTAGDGYASSIVMSDNYNAGVLIAKDLISKRKSAKIVILYDKAISSTNLRFQGFLDTIGQSDLQYSIVYTASGTTLLHETMVEMQKFLDLGLEFDVVLGCNDPAALGALAAIQNNHIKKDVLIYGIDGSPSAKMMVQQGYMEGTAAQFPSKVAKLAVQNAYSCLEGTSVEHKVKIPVQLITKENVDSYNVMGWQ